MQPGCHTVLAFSQSKLSLHLADQCPDWAQSMYAMPQTTCMLLWFIPEIRLQLAGFGLIPPAALVLDPVLQVLYSHGSYHVPNKGHLIKEPVLSTTQDEDED